MIKNRVTVTDDREVIIVSEQECKDILDAAAVARKERQSLRGTQNHWQKVGEIPATMYHREVTLPSKGQPDLVEDLTWRLLQRYPYLRTTEGQIGKRKRHI